jgi:RNA polymerase primary sigma factor
MDLIDVYKRELNHCSKLTLQEKKELIVTAKEGDAKAKEKLINNYLGLALSMALRFRNYGLDVYDLLGVSNLKLIETMEHIKNLDENQNFDSYVKVSIKNEIKDALRKEGIHRRIRNLDLETQETIEDKKTERPEQIIERKENIKKLEELLTTIDMEETTALKKYYIEGKNQETTAKELGKDRTTISRRIKTGLSKLKGFMEAA